MSASVLPVAVPPQMDMHVHSTFSDGKNTIEENIAEAEALGLRTLTCVDHVRMDTTYVPQFVAAVRALRPTTEVELLCAVEAKILDTAGTLDLPDGLEGVDRLYAADHQVPWTDGPRHPREVGEALQTGEVSAREVLEHLVDGTAGAVTRYPDVVLAHLFSVLPKLGLHEEDVPMDLIERLADATAAADGGRIEVSERWSCPQTRTLAPFVARGVPLLLSTDAHMRSRMGRYDHCARVVAELAG